MPACLGLLTEQRTATFKRRVSSEEARPEPIGKKNRHVGSVTSCLSFKAGHHSASGGFADSYPAAGGSGELSRMPCRSRGPIAASMPERPEGVRRRDGVVARA